MLWSFTWLFCFQQVVKDNAKIRETEEKIKRAKEIQEKREREKEQRNVQKQVLVDMNTGKKHLATITVIRDLYSTASQERLIRLLSLVA